MPIPFGVAGDTGCPIAGLTEAIVETVLPQREESKSMTLSLEQRSAKDFGTIGGLDPDDLKKVGWGIIFGRGVKPEIKAAIEPLINLRSEAQPMRIFEGDDAPFPGESAEAWLDRHDGVRMDVVDPSLGIPFYILIVAPLESISFQFQYSLDLYWAVGRLWFETSEEFHWYAESVVSYETMGPVRTAKKVAMFATEHDFDKATQLFMRQVARPMIDGHGNFPVPIGKEQGFELDTYLGERATKANLENILRGSVEGGASVLFSGTHGMQFGFQDKRQSLVQGALVCQDWEGYGHIAEKHWFGASDIPGDANFHGLIHVLFACHGAGCTEFDDFDRLNNEPRRIAEKPFLSMLPQALLSRRNGALAVLAHVERAWVYSFQGGRGRSQTQGFRDVISRLLLGQRIGHATDSFNMRWAVLSTQLSEKQQGLNRNVSFSPGVLAKLWIARDDARNFIVLGDPAVRVRIDKLSELR
jgi:Peptidase family C25